MDRGTWWTAVHGVAKKLDVTKHTSLVAQLVKNLPAMQETPIRFLGQEIHWRRERLPTPLFFGLPWWLRR